MIICVRPSALWFIYGRKYNVGFNNFPSFVKSAVDNMLLEIFRPGIFNTSSAVLNLHDYVELHAS